MKKILVLLIVSGCAHVHPDVSAPEPPKNSCCDYDIAEARKRLKTAWERAFNGDPPSDRDLQAYQDALEIMECLEDTCRGRTC